MTHKDFCKQNIYKPAHSKALKKFYGIFNITLSNAKDLHLPAQENKTFLILLILKVIKLLNRIKYLLPIHPCRNSSYIKSFTS